MFYNDNLVTTNDLEYYDMPSGKLKGCVNLATQVPMIGEYMNSPLLQRSLRPSLKGGGGGPIPFLHWCLLRVPIDVNRNCGKVNSLCKSLKQHLEHTVWSNEYIIPMQSNSNCKVLASQIKSPFITVCSLCCYTCAVTMALKTEMK